LGFLRSSSKTIKKCINKRRKNIKNKIVGTVICTLLICSLTTLAFTPSSKDTQQTKHQFFNTTPVPLQAPKTWIKTFGRIESSLGWSVHQTTDGGYIITGSKEYFSVHICHLWLIKTDSNGNKVWDKTFGGKGLDCGMSVQQTTDGGYIITGLTISFGVGSDDVWLIKTDSNGNKVWNKTFGGKGLDCGMSVQQITDGGYIITGYTKLFGVNSHSVLWLIKTDSQGSSILETKIR
jgi:hypothetical protein